MFPMHQCEQQEHHRLEELKTSGDIKAYTLTRNRKGEDGRDSECLTITLPNGKELQIFSCPRYGDDAGEEATCLHIQ